MIPSDLVPKDCPWPIVLGIDPGTRVLGYGALVVAPGGPRLLACGVLAPDGRAAVPARLAEIQVELEELLAALRPGIVAVERAFHAKNAQSAFRLGEARGVVLAAAARAGIEIREFAPASAKKAVLGHGGASKEQIARMIAQLLGTGPLDVPSDATDALALAFACTRRPTAGLAPAGQRRARGAGTRNGAVARARSARSRPIPGA